MNIWMKIEQKCSITNIFHLKKYFGDFIKIVRYC